MKTVSNYVERFSNARVLVTGGVGFIGSNLVRRLLDLGADVAVVDSCLDGSGANAANLTDVIARVRLVRSDVRDTDSYSELMDQCKFVFHLAAQTGHLDSMKNPALDLSINALGTLSLLESCRKHCPEAPLVFASTRQLYGTPVRLPVSETHPIRPPDINAVGKQCAEELIRVYQRLYGLRAVTLRLSNTYGPRMRIRDARQMFLGIWIRSVLEAKPVKVFGDGRQRRDLIHVSDVVEAMLKATDESLSGQTYNIGSEDSIELGSLARLLCELEGGSSAVELVPFPPERKLIDIGDYVGDYSAFRAATGWCAETGLQQGLMDTLAYYRAAMQFYLE